MIQEDMGAFDNLSGHVQSNPLYATFIQPFTDIVQTAGYAAKRIGAATGHEAMSVIKQSAMSLTPLIAASSMDEVKNETKLKIRQITQGLDKQYSQVLNRNIDAIMNQTDTWGMAFLFNPGLLLGSKLLLKTPEIAAGFLGSLLGGKARDPKELQQAQQQYQQCVIRQQRGENIDCSGLQEDSTMSIADQLATWAHELEILQTDPSYFFFSDRQYGGGSHGGSSGASVNWGDSSGGGGMGGDYLSGGDYGGDYGGVFQEQFVQQQQMNQKQIQQYAKNRIAMIKRQIQNGIKANSKNLAQALNGSKFGQQIREAALTTILNAAKRNLNFSDWQSMLNKNKNKPQVAALDQQITQKLQQEGQNEQQIIQSKNALIPSIKQTTKNMFIKQLEMNMQGASDPTSQKTLQNAINQIKAIV